VENISQTARLATAKEHLEMLKAGSTRTAIAVQQAAVVEAEARLALAKAKLAESVITAPFAGTITKVHVRPGALAIAKSPLIELTDLSSVVARFAVPESVAASVGPGMVLEFKLDAYPGKAFDGKVVRVYPDLDRRMRTRTVEARVNPYAGLMPGMFGRLKLNLETAHDAIVLPAEAIITTPAGRKAAFVVKDGKAMRRLVETGIEDGSRVQIVSGINPGDQVIVSGNEKLKDGAFVSLAGAEKSGTEKSKGKGMGKGSANASADSGGSRP
jgi:membrane fusion protein (multidrug efflux system)